MKNEDQELIGRYLLGELSDEQQAELEARYFADDELFEQLLVVEDELIERYARGAGARLVGRTFSEIATATQVIDVCSGIDEAHGLAIVKMQAEKRASWWDNLNMRLHIKSR